MAKYRLKPVVVEAHQWFKAGDDPDVRMRTNLPQDAHYCCPRCGKTYDRHGRINTLEGPHMVCPGDWIVTGLRGEKYAVKDSIFIETYEIVEAGGA